MIIDELIEYSLLEVQQRKIKDVRAGLGYTCVMLDNGNCGLAYSFRNALGDNCDALSIAGSLIGRSSEEIIPWLKDSNCLKSAIGLATINAVLNNSQKKQNIGSLLDIAAVSPTDIIGMVGMIKPVFEALESVTRNIYVFEENVMKCGDIYYENSISIRLPECSVVFIKATCIMNHTLDKVLLYCKKAREVCIIGPSTPLCPEVFRRYGVSLLAGSIVKNADSILEIISQGGGIISMQPAISPCLLRVQSKNDYLHPVSDRP